MQRLSSTVPAQVRGLATAVTRSPLSSLNAVARAKAEQITAQWKGTNAAGENVKNYIGGKFVDSQAEKWMDVVDPVGPDRPSCCLGLIVLVTVDPSLAFSGTRDDRFRVRTGR